MKIYIACLYSEMGKAKLLRSQLRAAGHECTSRWLDGAEEGAGPEAGAVMDLEDVARADVLILVTLPKGTLFKGGGRHVEFGYALALSKRVFVLGEKEHVFCHLPQVEVHPELDDILRELA